VTTSTRPRRYGVEKHGKGYRIRVKWRGHPEPFYTETGFADEPSAMTRALVLHATRMAGEPPPAAGCEQTLGDVLDAWRADREGLLAGKDGAIRASTLLRDDNSIKALRRYFDGAMPIGDLKRAEVVEKHRARAKAHPKAAQGELALLKSALGHAEDHGERSIDHGIHSIKPSPVPRRPRRALSSTEHDELVTHRVEYAGAGLLPAHELPAILGRTGLRIGEALALRDTDVDVAPDGSVELRIRSNKEGNPDKRVPVVHEGARLTLRGALTMRDVTRGARPLFADGAGAPLTYSVAYTRVWRPTVEAASSAWLAAHPAHDPDDDPFAELTPHDMRSTFATIMRSEYGLSKPTTAFLLGHSDGGATLDRVYDKSDRGELARAELGKLYAATGAGAVRYQSTGTAPAALEG